MVYFFIPPPISGIPVAFSCSGTKETLFPFRSYIQLTQICLYHAGVWRINICSICPRLLHLSLAFWNHVDCLFQLRKSVYHFSLNHCFRLRNNTPFKSTIFLVSSTLKASSIINWSNKPTPLGLSLDGSTSISLQWLKRLCTCRALSLRWPWIHLLPLTDEA